MSVIRVKSGRVLWAKRNGALRRVWPAAAVPEDIVVESSTVTEAAGGSITGTTPAGLTTGDLLVAYLAAEAGSSAGAQAGWVGPINSATGLISTNLYCRAITGTPDASYTMSALPTGGHSLILARLSGVDLDAIEDTAGAGFTPAASSNTITAPSLTTVTDGAVVLYGLGVQSGGATRIISGPAGTVLVAKDDDTLNQGRRAFLFSEKHATAGSTGTRTFSLPSGVSLPMAGSVLVLRPVVTAAAPATSARGPSGSTIVWEWMPDNGLDSGGVWRHLQNQETTTANQAITNWPNGTATRTTLPAGSSWDGVGRAVRFECRQGDIGGGAGNRSELNGALQSWVTAEGDERWLQYRFKVDPDFAITGLGYFIITQFHSGIGSPPVSISFNDARDLNVGGNAEGAPSHTLFTKAEFDAKRGQWIDLNLHLINSIDPAIGGLEVYLDGTLKVPWHNRATMASEENFLKIGMYRNTQISSTNVVYFDDVRLTAP